MDTSRSGLWRRHLCRGAVPPAWTEGVEPPPGPSAARRPRGPRRWIRPAPRRLPDAAPVPLPRYSRPRGAFHDSVPARCVRNPRGGRVSTTRVPTDRFRPRVSAGVVPSNRPPIQRLLQVPRQHAAGDGLTSFSSACCSDRIRRSSSNPATRSRSCSSSAESCPGRLGSEAPVARFSSREVSMARICLRAVAKSPSTRCCSRSNSSFRIESRGAPCSTRWPVSTGRSTTVPSRGAKTS